MFIEALPSRARPELFGALRQHGVEIWVARDQRLGLRLHDPSSFERVCVLLAELGHDIESLDLAHVPVADLEPLMYVRSVESLDLAGTRADLRALRHLVGLRSLSLAATDFDSLAPLAGLHALERLDLRDARAKLVGLGLLGELRELDLSRARTDPQGFELREGEGLALSGLSDLAALEVLTLRETKVRDWAPLARLWTVRELDLSYTNFVDLGLLEHYSQLRSLDLRRTAISDIGPLLGLAKLERVDLRECELVDPVSVTHLRRSRPRLVILD